MNNEERSFPHTRHSKTGHLGSKRGVVIHFQRNQKWEVTFFSISVSISSFLLCSSLLWGNFTGHEISLSCHTRTICSPHFECLPGSGPKCQTCSHPHHGFAFATPDCIIFHWQLILCYVPDKYCQSLTLNILRHNTYLVFKNLLTERHIICTWYFSM